MSKDLSIPLWQQAIITFSRTFVGLVIVLALYWGRPVLIPIALATLLTILLNPIVRGLQRLGVVQAIAVILTVSIAGVALSAVGMVGSRQITKLLAELPENTAKIIKKLKTAKSLASGRTAVRIEQMIEDISRELKLSTVGDRSAKGNADDPEAATQSLERIVLVSEPMPWMKLSGHLGNAVESLATLAFTMVLLMFFLMERQGLRDRIVLLAGKTRLTLTSKALDDATARVSRYIVMVEIVNGGFGLVLGGGLFIMGVPYAVLWGCMATLLRFLPYIGPWIGAFFPIVTSLAMSEGWWQPLTVFVFVLALELFTNNVIEPIVFGRTTGVAPAALLISAAFWLFIWGPIGLVLSAPFAVSLVVIGKNIPQLGFLNILLGDQPALTDDVSFYQRLLLGDRLEAHALVVKRVREPEPERIFDELMIPALNYLKRDLRRGQLTEKEVGAMLELLRDSISSVDVPHQEATAQDSMEADSSLSQVQPKRLRLLGCAADGDVDRVALAILQKSLDPAHWELELAAAEILTSELVAGVAAEPPTAICITAVSPGGIAQVRYLCKKLRAAGVELPLIVGRWSQRQINPTDRERLAEAGANGMAATLLETRHWLESRYHVLDQPALVAAVIPTLVTQSRTVARAH